MEYFKSGVTPALKNTSLSFYSFVHNNPTSEKNEKCTGNTSLSFYSFVNNNSTSAYKIFLILFGSGWPGWKWIATGRNFKFFLPGCFSAYSSSEKSFGIFLPELVESNFMLEKRFVNIYLRRYDQPVPWLLIQSKLSQATTSRELEKVVVTRAGRLRECNVVSDQ